MRVDASTTRMIRNRPEVHAAIENYRGLPKPPYRVDIEKIPDLVRSMLFPIRHVEPLTTDALPYTGEFLGDFPEKEEFAYYKKLGAKFQLVFVVINSIYVCDEGEARLMYPYSISLIPASKRHVVEESSADFVEMMVDNEMLRRETAYLHLDPFVGEWGFWSDLGLIADMGQENAFTDELGLVFDYFYLRTEVPLDEVVQPSIEIEGDRQRRYLKHRSRLLYTPFRFLQSRRVWGVENGLELFVLHELVRRGAPFPTIQARIYADATFPTLYHAWVDWDDEKDAKFISEVDFLFEEQRVAVFCDGARHRKKKIIERDVRIDQNLKSAGYRVIRLSSRDILRDVEAAANLVTGYL